MNEHKNSNLNPNLFMFILTLFSALATAILIIIGILIPSLLEPKNSYILNPIVFTIYFILPILLYTILKKVKIKDIIPLNPLSLKNFILVIFISFSVIPLTDFVSSIGDVFFENIIIDELYQETSNLNLFQLLFTIALVPAIAEELAFRGVILSGYKKNSLITAMLMSSLYFGMMHGNLNQFVYTTLCGIFMAFLVKITNSIYSSMIMHFIFNARAGIFLYFLVKNNPATAFNELTKPTTIKYIKSVFIIFLISLPFLLLSIFLFIKNNKDEIKKLKDENIAIKNNPNKPKVFTAFFYVNIILFILQILFLTLIKYLINM
ncbi:CPBP family intramembrane glutamic endopeptidase [[Clostridium] colinum]|uniref:CPBP family intramembrane glutamic endopeptidase n=1 Tax=[Clostridium] colinum TaxID=36835 RepID=UPI00202543B4|nr:CPBP family intramembrane glutamic endopeptidase [[Clostridium] colinum]